MDDAAARGAAPCTTTDPRAAMHPTDPKPLSDYFEEGVQARFDGKVLHDNPYAAGSAKRREWHAGFCATADRDEGRDAGALGPGIGAPRRRGGDD